MPNNQSSNPQTQVKAWLGGTTVTLRREMRGGDGTFQRLKDDQLGWCRGEEQLSQTRWKGEDQLTKVFSELHTSTSARAHPFTQTPTRSMSTILSLTHTYSVYSLTKRESTQQQSRCILRVYPAYCTVEKHFKIQLSRLLYIPKNILTDLPSIKMPSSGLQL